MEEGRDFVKSGSNIQNITKELILEESGRHPVPSSVSSTPFFNPPMITTNLAANTDSGNIKERVPDPFEPQFPIDESTRSGLGSNVGSQEHNKRAPAEGANKKELGADFDKNLPETVALLTTPDGGKLYLVGTAHFSVQSQEDVSKVIQAVQPHTVVVELCKDRIGLLHWEEGSIQEHAKNPSLQDIIDAIRTEGACNGLVHILMRRMNADLSKELGLLPGGEFRRAFREAIKIPNCKIHLADRPINITLQRALRSLSWWQMIKIWWQLAVLPGDISQEDVEHCKEQAVLDEMIEKMAVEFPSLGEVFITERDLFLTYGLQENCVPFHTPAGAVPARVVGVVGVGHVAGIVKNWGKVNHCDIEPLMRIPPMSLSTKILQFTFKASLVGAVLYIGYKYIPIPSVLTIHNIKSSVEGLVKVSLPK